MPCRNTSSLDSLSNLWPIPQVLRLRGRLALPEMRMSDSAANRQEHVSHPTRDEIEWERVAEFHLEHGEPNAARLAATVSDTLRFYRLHMEAKGNPGWQA